MCYAAFYYRVMADGFPLGDTLGFYPILRVKFRGVEVGGQVTKDSITISLKITVIIRFIIFGMYVVIVSYHGTVFNVCI